MKLKITLWACVCGFFFLPTWASEKNVWVYDKSAATLSPKDESIEQWKFKVVSYSRAEGKISLSFDGINAAYKNFTTLNLDDLIVEDAEGEVQMSGITFKSGMFGGVVSSKLTDFRCNCVSGTSINFFRSSTTANTIALASLRDVAVGGEGPNKIETSAFQGSTQLTNVVFNLPNLTTINARAFTNCCRLVHIEGIENVQKIGAAAFANCTSLTSRFEFANLETLGASAFLNCQSLESISIQGTITNFPENVFRSCSKLAISATEVISPGASGIGESAFRDTPLKGKLTLTNLTSIGKHAFRATGLSEVDLSGPISSLGDSAFYLCSNLETFTFNLPNLMLGYKSCFAGTPEQKKITFRDKPLRQPSLYYLLVSSPDVTNEHASIIYVDTNRWMTFASDARYSAFQDAEEAARGKSAAKTCFGVCVVLNGTTTYRRAWFAQVSKSFVLRIR